MKCKHCDGDGVIVDVEYGHAGKYGCKYCDGKGVVEPLTEQEWLQTATTEQLAEFLNRHGDFCTRQDCVSCDFYMGDGERCKMDSKTDYEVWVEWLKQPHQKE